MLPKSTLRNVIYKMGSPTHITCPLMFWEHLAIRQHGWEHVQFLLSSKTRISITCSHWRRNSRATGAVASSNFAEHGQEKCTGKVWKNEPLNLKDFFCCCFFWLIFISLTLWLSMTLIYILPSLLLYTKFLHSFLLLLTLSSLNLSAV